MCIEPKQLILFERRIKEIEVPFAINPIEINNYTNLYTNCVLQQYFMGSATKEIIRENHGEWLWSIFYSSIPFK